MHTTLAARLRAGFCRLLAASVAACASWTAAASPVETVALFNPTAFETPESIQFDRHGVAYVSLALTGEIRKRERDGSWSTLAFLPVRSDIQPCGNGLGFGVMGSIAIDHQRNVYASVISCDVQSIGVWKVRPDGDASLLARLPAQAGPNGLAYDRGWLYASDTLLGVIWRIHSDGTQPAEVWADDSLLKPVPLPLTPGPNGLQVFRNEVYVAVSDRRHIVAFPFRRNGTAGPPRVHASGVDVDDFAFDVKGNIYATTDPFNTVLRIAPDGSVKVLLTAADGLDGPTSASFGVGDDSQNLYITNAAFPFFQRPEPPRPSLLRIHVGTPGRERH